MVDDDSYPQINTTHPEMLPGEIYLGNVDKKTFDACVYTTKRTGDHPRNSQGVYTPRALPLFAQESEWKVSPMMTAPGPASVEASGTVQLPWVLDDLPPIHPGKILKDELDALGMNTRDFADHIHVSHVTVAGIVKGRSPVNAQMAIRLGMALGTTPQYWINLQAIHDMKQAQAELLDEPLNISCLFKVDDSSKQKDST